MPHPSHPHLFGHPNHIWWRVKIMKLLILLLSSLLLHPLS
jgi:hypothetical protein